MITLLDEAVMNAIVSVVVLILAGVSYWLCYHLWLKRKDNFQQTPVKLSSRVIMALTLFILALPLGFFSYYLLFFEPFVVMCRFGSCVFGPYGWAAALLSLGGALLLVITGCLLVFQLKKSEKVK